MSNPASISGVDLTTPQGRQILQDALDVLYGLIQKAGGVAAGPTTFDELRVRMLTVLGTINVVPEDKPPANVNSRLVTPWLTGQRGRGEVWRFEDQNDGGDLLEVRSQPYLIGTPTATSGDWEFRFTSAQRDPAGAYRSLGAIRFSSSGRIRTYDASEVVTFDSTTALTSTTAPLPKRYVEGLVIRYATSSTITVSAGKARDKADSANMTLAAEVTVDLTTVNAALGVERKALTGSFTFTNASTSVSVSGGSVLSEFGTRSLSGITLTSSAAVFTASSSILGLIAVGDLVGHSSKGHWRVDSITSSTTFTTYTTPGSAFAGEAASVVEYPVIESAGGKVYTMRQITSAGAIVLVNTATGTESSVSAYATSKKTNPVSTDDGWRAVWLLSGGSGTTVALSTQRTTPYLSITGYTTSYRRIGWVLIDTSGNVYPHYGTDVNGTRIVYAEANGAAVRVASNLSSTTSWQDVACNTQVPPTARAIWATIFTYQPNTAAQVFFRGRGLGHAGVGRALGIQANSATTWAYNPVRLLCDGAQYLQHGAGSATGDGTYADIIGYEDTLE